jgi:hypothetical protein
MVGFLLQGLAAMQGTHMATTTSSRGLTRLKKMMMIQREEGLQLEVKRLAAAAGLE